MAQHLSYKGMPVELVFEGDDQAAVTIAGRPFALVRHEGPLRLWACEDAYFMAEDPMDVVRHLVDYWYVIDSPERAKFEGPHHGDLPELQGGVLSAHPIAPSELVPDDEEGGHTGHPGHRSQGGTKRSGGKRGSTRSRRR